MDVKARHRARRSFTLANAGNWMLTYKSKRSQVARAINFPGGSRRRSHSGVNGNEGIKYVENDRIGRRRCSRAARVANRQRRFATVESDPAPPRYSARARSIKSAFSRSAGSRIISPRVYTTRDNYYFTNYTARLYTVYDTATR